MHIEVNGADRPGRWRQIVNDLGAMAPETDWARTVTEARVRTYDRIRPFVTRGFLLAVVVITSAVLPGTRRWVWVMFIPAVVQVFLEIILEEPANHDVLPEMPDGDPRKPLVEQIYANHEEVQANPPGVLGGFATLLLVGGQVFGTGPEGPGWVKVLGFAAALLYATSAVIGPTVDVVVYSPLQKTFRWLRRSRPWWWLVAIGLAAGVVRMSESAAVWPHGTLPYAYLACLIPYGISYRAREYERAIDCAGLVARSSISTANEHAALELHGIVQPFKANIETLLDKSTPGRERAELINFFAVMRAVHERVTTKGIDLQDGIMPPLQAIVRRSFGTTGLNPPPDIQLHLDDLDGHNMNLAQRVLTTLGDNAAQAYAKRPTLMHRPIRVVGMHSDGHVQIAVSDALELISDEVWNDSLRTVYALRMDLERYGGSLVQQQEPDGGKSIVATWVPELRPLRRHSEEDGE